jgi:ribosomal protein L36
MTLLSIVHDIIDFAQVDMHYKYLYKRKYTKKIYKINKKNDKHKQKQKGKIYINKIKYMKLLSTYHIDMRSKKEK